MKYRYTTDVFGTDLCGELTADSLEQAVIYLKHIPLLDALKALKLGDVIDGYSIERVTPVKEDT